MLWDGLDGRCSKDPESFDKLIGFLDLASYKQKTYVIDSLNEVNKKNG